MPNTKARPRKMTEVARLAGVSLSTVSRALAGHSRISEQTRQRVREVAQNLGYQLDVSASNLRTGVTRTIAVVIPLSHATRQRLSDPFFLEMLGALADELTARGYGMLLRKVTQPPADWLSSLIRARRVDGVIVIGQSLHHDELDKAARAELPLVVWGSRLEGQHYVTVGSDNEAGALAATSHLIEQGCRRIVFLGDSEVPEVQARLRGYLAALESARIARGPGLELPVRFGSGASYERISALLHSQVPFDGVFACSDVIAMSAMRALSERGRRIPSDVAVVGFDDIPLAAFTTPPLSTVRQDHATGARSLVEKLLQIISGRRPESEVIPIELVVRASSLRHHHARADTDRRRRSRVSRASNAAVPR